MVTGGPVAAIVALAVLTVWRDQGSIALRDWAPYALIGALVLAVCTVSGAAVAPPRGVALAAAALVGLGAWDAVSLTWSAAPALGRDEALLPVLYAVALLLPTLVLQGRQSRIWASGTIVAAIGGLAVATAVELIAATEASPFYDVGRLSFPIAYPNAQAAFFLLGAWPALVLAAMRELPILVRALALGAAAGVLGGWALTQSKGGAVGLALSLTVVLAVSRRRLRLLVPIGLTATLVGVAFTTLTAPYGAQDNGGLASIHRAGWAELLLVAGGAFVGVAYAVVDRRTSVPERVSRRLAQIALAALVASFTVAIAAFFVHTDHPGAFVASKWKSFKHLPDTRVSSTHFGEIGSNRYDFWRVALDEFAAHPVAGIGARGFRAAYLEQRRSTESPARAHSLELDVLSETGIVGFALLALALGAVVAAFARRARDELVAVGALGAFACWFAQASVDWTWTFPAIGVVLFSLLGTAAARGDGAPPLRGRIAVPLAAGAAAVALGAFGLPWLSARYVRAALAGHGVAELATARALDPISVDPYLAQAALAPTPAAGIQPLVAAVRMEPRSADLLYALGRQQALAGRRVAARRTFERALGLDPNDEAIKSELANLP